MGTESQICQSITKNLCQLEVIELIKKYRFDSDSILFGATTDIDNLGYYSARNGRAKTQNLVDLYTNALIIIVSDFKKRNSENIDLVLIPAGEEITILGIGKDEETIIKFFSELENNVYNYLRSFEILDPEMTGISIGYKVFNDNSIDDMIKSFLEMSFNTENNSYAEVYYKILFEIRERITPEIDQQKFKDLDLITNKHRIFFRNYIYYKLIEYKNGTKKDIVAMSENGFTNKIDGEFEIISEKYGLNEEKYLLVKKLSKKFLGV
jgi:hypothetical protein